LKSMANFLLKVQKLSKYYTLLPDITQDEF
jgi:hypothetical protein